MKNVIAILSSLITLLSQAQDERIIYPPAPKSDAKETIWGNEISDPYRSLESDSKERAEWLSQEKEVTDAYFKKLKHKLDIDYDYNLVSRAQYNIPQREGPYYIERMTKEDVINVYYKKTVDQADRDLLLSPLWISSSLHGFNDIKISKDGKYVACSYSLNGSDWQEIGVYDINRKVLLKDHIKNVKFSQIVWLGHGFFYSRFDAVDEKGRYTDIQYDQRIYFHKIGTNSDADSLIYQHTGQSVSIFTIQVTDDGRYLTIQGDSIGGKPVILFKDLSGNNPFVPMAVSSTTKTNIIGSKDSFLFAWTTYPDAYNGSIVEINTKHPQQWQKIMGNQKDYLIKDVVYVKDTFYVVYEHNFTQILTVLSAEGDILKQIVRPVGSDTRFICYSPERGSLILLKSYFTCPPIGEELLLKDLSLKLIDKTKVVFDPLKYVFYVTSYRASDSTSIPIYIIEHEDYITKGPRPVLLEVYGGFGMTPEISFDPGLVLFLRQGGVFAFANVRGGANSVKDWHESGSLLNKQKTFDDTYDAARYLIDKGYAAPGKIAITGASNGGMVGAAVVNQHPEMFKAALLVAGAYDMIRFENFTIGAYHRREFGSVKNPVEFINLRKYSPLHNIKADTTYPAMLIMTSDFDDRVPPFHSYKYVAALQEMTHSPNPVLLRIEKNEGHHQSASMEKRTKRNREFYLFLFKELGMKYRNMTL